MSSVAVSSGAVAKVVNTSGVSKVVLGKVEELRCQMCGSEYIGFVPNNPLYDVEVDLCKGCCS